MQRGFIQVPILMAIIISAIVFGGGGYLIANEMSHSSQDILDSKTETATTNVEVNTGKDSQKNENTNDSSQTVVDTSLKGEVIVPETKDFKDSVLSSIDAQINSYQGITNWIDDDMMPLLSQRETMLNELKASTNSLMANEADSSVDYAYSLFVEAYNLDKTQIVDFYRDVFSDIKNHINTEKVSALNAEYAKFSAKSVVSETEYNAEIQMLAQYQSNWQSLYNDGVKLAMTQFMTQTNAKDEMYQRLWTDLSGAVSDFNKTKTLEASLSKLYSQRVKPINCTFSSHYDGFGSVGSLNCY